MKTRPLIGWAIWLVGLHLLGQTSIENREHFLLQVETEIDSLRILRDQRINQNAILANQIQQIKLTEAEFDALMQSQGISTALFQRTQNPTQAVANYRKALSLVAKNKYTEDQIAAMTGYKVGSDGQLYPVSQSYEVNDAIANVFSTSIRDNFAADVKKLNQYIKDDTSKARAKAQRRFLFSPKS